MAFLADVEVFARISRHSLGAVTGAAYCARLGLWVLDSVVGPHEAGLCEACESVELFPDFLSALEELQLEAMRSGKPGIAQSSLPNDYLSAVPESNLVLIPAVGIVSGPLCPRLHAYLHDLR